MAEGFLRASSEGSIEAYSAGTNPRGLHPLAVEVMREVGIDISQQHSKGFEPFLDQHFDWVITVCDRAKESCPIFITATSVAHWDFDDPAAVQGSAAERTAVFRRVRDEIRHRIRLFLLAQRPR